MNQMDHKYLKETQYNWDRDPRHLKIKKHDLMIIPDGRCIHCGRIFLNGGYGVAFCRDCDIAMSTNPMGPEHDFDTWGNKIKIKDPESSKEEKKTISIVLTARRQIRGPIDFDKEHEYFDRSGNNKDEPHFITGAGKIVSTGNEEEDERIRRLYEL